MKLFASLLVLVALSFASCHEDCDTPGSAKCSESPETGTTCMAYFESWFYDESTGECEKIGYSGCEPVGFDNKVECDKCDCNKSDEDSK